MNDEELYTLNELKAMELDAVRAALPSTYYAALAPHVRVGFMATAWNHAIAVNAELESEIARHHELIIKLRETLKWTLGIIDNGVNGRWPDEFIEDYEAAQRFLNREVG